MISRNDVRSSQAKDRREDRCRRRSATDDSGSEIPVSKSRPSFVTTSHRCAPEVASGPRTEIEGRRAGNQSASSSQPSALVFESCVVVRLERASEAASPLPLRAKYAPHNKTRSSPIDSHRAFDSPAVATQLKPRRHEEREGWGRTRPTEGYTFNSTVPPRAAPTQGTARPFPERSEVPQQALRLEFRRSNSQAQIIR